MSGTVKIELTPAEADALWVLAGEGAEAILTDDSQVSACLGGKRGADAAQRALSKLTAARNEGAKKEKGK
jgi:hypothetical protein